MADGDNENSFGLYIMYSASDGNDGCMVDMIIEGQNVKMQLDTGACVSLVSEIMYEGSLAHLVKCRRRQRHFTLSPCKMPLSSFSGEPIPMLWKVFVNVEFAQDAAKVPLVIVKGY